MDCCSINGLAEEFNRSYVQRDLQGYRKNGLSERATLAVDYLRGQGLEGRSLLEIGSGLGTLLLALLKAGAEKAVGVDVSPSYVEVARELAEEAGYRDSVEYVVGDFVAQSGEIGEADVVLLDRVICCYPEMVPLVTTSAQHARHFYVLIYPRNVWWVRWAIRTIRILHALWGSAYRPYYHPTLTVENTVASLGFAEEFHTPWGAWEVAVWRRGG